MNNDFYKSISFDHRTFIRKTRVHLWLIPTALDKLKFVGHQRW